jgi:hypothetical protein
MKLSEFESVAQNATEEDEYTADESETAQDLGEALELLGDCQEMLERMLLKTGKRRPLNAIDVKDITDLSQEVLAFLDQWTLPSEEPKADAGESVCITGITREVDDENDW